MRRVGTWVIMLASGLFVVAVANEPLPVPAPAPAAEQTA